VKTFLSFCCNQESCAATAGKLQSLCDLEDPTEKGRFLQQLEFLLAEAWPLRHGVVAAPAMASSLATSPTAPLYGSFAPSNTMSMGSYAPVFAPVVNVNLPSTPQPTKTAELPRNAQRGVTGEAGMQQSVLAYFSPPKGADLGRRLTDLTQASDEEVLKHFGLSALERANQRSDFINKFVADAARKKNVNAVLDESWRTRVHSQAKEVFNTATANGDLMMKTRGEKKKKRDGRDDRPTNADFDDAPPGGAIFGGSDALGGDDYDGPAASKKSGKSGLGATSGPRQFAPAKPVYSSESSEEPDAGDEVSMSDLNGKRNVEASVKEKNIVDENASKKQKADGVAVKIVDYKRWTKPQLQVFLKEHNVAVSGKKAELLARVQKIVADKIPKEKQDDVEAEPMLDSSGNILPMESEPTEQNVGSGVLSEIEEDEPIQRQKSTVSQVDPLSNFFQGEGVVRVGEMAVAAYDSALVKVRVDHVCTDDSGLFGCHIYNIEEPVWVARQDLLSFPIPRHTKYSKGHFVLFCGEVADPCYKIARLREDCHLTICGSEVKIFKSRLDGPTNYVSLDHYKSGILHRRRPGDVIFDLVLSGEQLDEDDFLWQSLLFLGIRLKLVKSTK
jgi:hypothetical protein